MARHTVHYWNRAIPTATGVGEHTLLLILALLKQVVLAHNALVEGRWLHWALRPATRDLVAKTSTIADTLRVEALSARALPAQPRGEESEGGACPPPKI